MPGFSRAVRAGRNCPLRERPPDDLLRVSFPAGKLIERVISEGYYPLGALAGSIGLEFRKTISEIWEDPLMLSLPALPIMSLNTT